MTKPIARDPRDEQLPRWGPREFYREGGLRPFKHEQRRLSGRYRTQH
jgi:hypothetical protein